MATRQIDAQRRRNTLSRIAQEPLHAQTSFLPVILCVAYTTVRPGGLALQFKREHQWSRVVRMVQQVAKRSKTCTALLKFRRCAHSRMADARLVTIDS